MTDETKTPETNEPTDFVLRVQVGYLFNFKSTPETVTADMHALFEKFAAAVKALDFAPEVVHVIDGDAMSKADFDKAKEQAKAQIAAVQEVMRDMQEKLGPGAVLQATVNGQVLRADSEIVDALPGESEQPGAELTVAGEAADAIEASEGAFRVGGTRTLN